MPYVIDINEIFKGDVILRRWPDDNLSRRVMEETRSNYSHALLCVDYSSVIDAGKIVQSKNPLRDDFENKDDALVLRLKPQFKCELIVNKAVEFARRTIGTQYSYREAKEVLNNTGDAKEPNRQICTRLIAKAFENAGLIIVANTDYPTIKDLEDSPYFECVSNCVMEVTPQIRKVLDSEYLIPKQTEIISQLLKDCRKLYPNEDIQTFEQLFSISFKHPDRNEQLSELISKSGYLDLWKEEEYLNPHNFDTELFLKEMGEYSKIAALQSLEANDQCYDRFSRELNTLKKLKNFGNPVVDIMTRLYENLVDQCQRRSAVLKEVLRRTENIKI